MKDKRISKLEGKTMIKADVIEEITVNFINMDMTINSTMIIKVKND